MIELAHLGNVLGFLGGLALALGLGAILHARGRGKPPLERLSLVLCPVAVYLGLFVLGEGIARAPEQDWNAARLAPAVALARGIRLYTPPGAGAVLNTIYPPMSYLVYTPAALFRTPTGAVIAGTAISAWLYFAPAVLLVWLGHRGRPEGRIGPLHAVVVLTIFGQMGLASWAMRVCLMFIHADAPMVAFAALGCLPLYLARESSRLSTRVCVASALGASLAVWSKQTIVPVLVVLPLWVLLTRGSRQGLRYATALGAVLLGCSFAFRLAFGLGSLSFNIFRIPSRHAWVYQGAQLAPGLLSFAIEFFYYAAPTAGLIAVLAALKGAKGEEEPGAGPETPESGGRGIGAWLSGRSWLLFAAAAAAAVPTCLLGRIKQGGAINNFAPTLYLLAFAAIALLRELYEENGRRGLAGRNAMLSFVMLASFFSPLGLLSPDTLYGLNALHRPRENPQQAAYRYARRHPRTAYFPWNPLSTLLAERRLYHFEYGMVDRSLAGFDVSAAHFRAHVPEKMRYVCFPPNNPARWTMKYLPGYTRQVEISELPGWTCYEHEPNLVTGDRRGGLLR